MSLLMGIIIAFGTAFGISILGAAYLARKADDREDKFRK